MPEITIAKVDLLIEDMTLEEKIGQLLIVGMKEKTFGDELDHLIRQYHVGGIILLGKNISHPAGILKLLNESKRANSGYEIPLFISVDEEGGRVSRLPSSMRKLPAAEYFGRIDDEKLAYQTGEYLADLLHGFGYNMNYAPVLDVHSNPKNPVIGDRSFSSDPHAVADLGMAVMKGMTDNGIISVVKHFPGHGDTHVDSHLSLPVIEKTLDELREIELIPFQRAIEEQADAIMVAHIMFPELDDNYPSSLSKKIITDLLREEMQFEGVVITDDLTMGAIVNDYTVPEAAVQSFNAGSDLLLIAGDYENQVGTINALMAAVKAGTISEERIDASVRRILRLKERYKLKDDPIEEIDLNLIEKKFLELMK
ncbi:beta-N-acetylhexosaminidase [Sporosarcina luteola]|uniref:beta-N-acetylhexosaminidase n=1 Tax=Sporosarcina luteola TaxID=582850 RepID=UPI0020425058|nr:beta-N-acetylhexosaminidase [Sporosarcina luteola]MCM3711307.1 beta-N-acetylhexosaminidase [Sporosarcina luteola]